MSTSTGYKKFFVDAMLGNIAKKMRLLGFDTKYSADISDDEILETAKEDNRIIISKDEQLVRKSHKNGIESIFVSNDSEKEHFVEICKKCNLKRLKLDGDTARCPKCNFQTHPTNKERIDGLVPKKVLDFNEKFWKCDNCDQVYWEGTHIKNLQNFVDEINERL